MKTFVISLPSTETLPKFQNIIRPIFKKVLATQREIKQLETLRDTLLPKLMNGEIEVKKMYNYFEIQLKEKSEAQSSNDLWVQWETAKKYAPSVLSLIVNVFPHFSLHDVSHSETILEIIRKILGDNQIRKLSATDIWMLLFSAYFHDIGMFVSKDDISELINNEEFLAFLKKAQEDKNSDVYPYALLFCIKDNKLYYKEENVTPESFNALRFLFAAFIRKSHAKRSKAVIETYKTSSFMFMPESIPHRIIDLLADVCCYHQENFEKVMELPQIQNGVFDDYCHPRFIACMIRLGDVLDVDNNRFSPVILSTLPSIPTDSLKHIEKHLSITNLNINSSEISIKAECKTIEIGEITNAWFSWISNEINQQTKNWHSIIPDASFCSLPIIKQLDVKIMNFDTISGNEIPHLSITSNKATELLQGSGIYNNKLVFARELLQNSIDATLLRIFIDNKSKLENGEYTTFKEICKKEKDNYRIIFSINTDKTDDSILNIKIEDYGIGIDLEDLKYIITNGEKGRNPKTDIQKSMPNWMMPSGIFGIGLYSIFLLTDNFTIETTKINNGSSIYGKIYDPKSAKKGAVYIQTKKNALTTKIGTIISFQYKSNKYPNHLSFNQKSHYVEEMYRKFDFIKNQETNFELSQIIDEVCAVGYHSYIPISLEIDNEVVDLYTAPPDFKYFDKNNSLEFNVYPKNYFNQVFYRNQRLEDFNIHPPFFSLQLNLLCGNAKDKLNLGRTKLKSEYIPVFYETLKTSLIEILEHNFAELDDEIKPFVGMFLELNKGKDIIEETPWRKAWKNFEIKLDNKILKLSKICEMKSIILQYTNVNKDIDKRCNVSTNMIKYVFNDHENIFINFVQPYLLAKHYYISWAWNKTDNESFIEISKNKKDYISDFQSFREHILSYSHMARCLIPCNEKYKELKLSKKYIDSIGYKNILPLSFYSYTEDIDFMALPYITTEKKSSTYGNEITRSDDDVFYKTIFINRKDNKISENTIKKVYEKFIEDFNGTTKKTKKKSAIITKKTKKS